MLMCWLCLRLVGFSMTRIRARIIPEPFGPMAWMPTKCSDVISEHYFHKIKSKLHGVLSSDSISLVSQKFFYIKHVHMALWTSMTYDSTSFANLEDSFISTFHPSILPISLLRMKPAISGSHGSILTWILINHMFHGKVGCQLTDTNSPIKFPRKWAKSVSWYSSGRLCIYTHRVAENSYVWLSLRLGVHHSTTSKALSIDQDSSWRVYSWLDGNS